MESAHFDCRNAGPRSAPPFPRRLRRHFNEGFVPNIQCKGERTMSDQYTTPTSGQSFPLTGKKHDIVTKYLADALGLEGHIYQAIDKQVKETQDEPDVNPLLRNIRDTLERHTE